MKAIVVPRYGRPEVVELRDLPTTVALDGEVLVKVDAASVNSLDWRRVRGSPFLVRLSEGLRRPKRPRLGVDFSGRVEAQGKGASEFRAGDEVFGVAYGAFGEYVSAAEKEIVLKPPTVSFEAAATVGIAALTALQALRDTGQIRPGHKVLINGAGGGVGTFAVQIAKSFGAEVTAVSTPGNLEMLRSIGADHVLDYTREDFTRSGRQFDIIFDLHPTRSVAAYKRVLTPDGIGLTVGFGGISRLLALALRGWFTSKTRGRRVRFMIAKPTKKDLVVLRDLLASGRIRPVIDRRYRLDQVPEALRYLESGQAAGKLLITVASGTGVG